MMMKEETKEKRSRERDAKRRSGSLGFLVGVLFTRRPPATQNGPRLLLRTARICYHKVGSLESLVVIREIQV